MYWHHVQYLLLQKDVVYQCISRAFNSFLAKIWHLFNWKCIWQNCKILNVSKGTSMEKSMDKISKALTQVFGECSCFSYLEFPWKYVRHWKSLFTVYSFCNRSISQLFVLHCFLHTEMQCVQCTYNIFTVSASLPSIRQKLYCILSAWKVFN